MIYAEVAETHDELAIDETYILMPCKAIHDAAGPYACMPSPHAERIPHGTSHRDQTGRQVNEAGEVMREIGCQILGEEVLTEAQARLAENEQD